MVSVLCRPGQLLSERHHQRIVKEAHALKTLEAPQQAVQQRRRADGQHIPQLRGSGLEAPAAAGSFFQLIDYGAFSSEPDVAMAGRLLTEAGVATIPLSVFYQSPPPLHYLRLCFAKREATLQDGAARLRHWASGARGSRIGG